jgi:hypothetical protein
MNTDRIIDAGHAMYHGAIVRKLERELAEVTEQRDRLEDALEATRKANRTCKYWQGVSECDCYSPLPQGGCLRCDMDKAVELLTQIVFPERSMLMHQSTLDSDCKKDDPAGCIETPCSASWIGITDDPRTWPKPKTAVLVLVRDDTHMVTGYIDDLGEGEGDQWWECEKVNLKDGTWDDTYDSTLWTPTHWMPLPSLPNADVDASPPLTPQDNAKR